MNTTPPGARAAGSSMAASAGSKAAAAGIAGALLGLVIGYGVGRVSTGTPINPLSDQKGGYEAGYQAAMQKVAGSGLLPPSPTASSSLSGTVKAVSEGSMTIETNASLDPLDLKSLPKTRTVTITSSTVLVRLTARTPEERSAAESAFAEAMTDFEPDPNNPSAPPTPPNQFKETMISASELKAGDQVNVTAAADILSTASFEAVQIMVLPTFAGAEAGALAPPPPANL